MSVYASVYPMLAFAVYHYILDLVYCQPTVAIAISYVLLCSFYVYF